MPVAKIDNAGATGDTVLLGAQAGCKYRVHGYVFQCAGAVNVKFKSGTTDLTPALTNASGTGISSGFNPDGWFAGGVNEDLIINASAGIQVSGHLDYSVVGPRGGAVGVNSLQMNAAKNGMYFPLLIP